MQKKLNIPVAALLLIVGFSLTTPSQGADIGFASSGGGQFPHFSKSMIHQIVEKQTEPEYAPAEYKDALPDNATFPCETAPVSRTYPDLGGVMCEDEYERLKVSDCANAALKVAENKDKKADQNKDKDSYKKVDLHCFSDLENLGKRFDDANVKDVMGIFVEKRNGVENPFCAGLLLDNGEVMTAKHCFYEMKEQNAGKAKYSYDDFANDKLWFCLLSDLSHKYFITPTDFPVERFGTQNDYVEVSLKNFPEMNVKIEYGTPEDKQKVFVISASSFVNKTEWKERIRITKPGTCFVSSPNANGCLVYSCNTSRGFSGAPIFFLNGDTIKVVGIHSGPGKGSTCDTNDTFLFRSNVGVVFPTD